MSCEVVERELFELPAAFRGLPYRDQALAFDTGNAALPVHAARGLLGEADLELLSVNAAAHYLKLDGASMPTPTSAVSTWRTTSYGAIVATILNKLPRENGRVRRMPLG